MNSRCCRFVLFASISALLTSMTAFTQLPTITQVAPSSGDEFQISMTPVQAPPPGSDTFDLSTMDGALPHYALVC